MMTPQTVLLSPIDAWFFRDGRPYNEGESNQTDVVSQFPPPATTLVGALRAALARKRGWNGAGPWNATLNAILGNGFDDLGPLRFQGPWLVRKTADHANEPLFPMPLNVLGKPVQTNENSEPGWQPACLLAPGPEVECDLGRVRLPSANELMKGLKEPASQWVTADGLSRILRGELPSPGQFCASRDLWQTEARVGLKRKEPSNPDDKGTLYSPRFVRLARDVSLAMTIDGLSTDWQWKNPELLALGGEGRMADCRSVTQLALPMTPLEAIHASHRVAVTLITPLLLPDAYIAAMSQPLWHDAPRRESRRGASSHNVPFFDWPGTTIISACIGKPQSLGGWDSIKREPLPLRPVLPAGSTWFLEVTDPRVLDTILSKHGQSIGSKTQYGFGQILLGAWPSSESGVLS